MATAAAAAALVTALPTTRHATKSIEQRCSAKLPIVANTIRYDKIEEFNVDSKAEFSA